MRADRRHYSRLYAGLLLLLVIVFSSAPASAEKWDGARVVLASGWEYVNMSVERVPGESAITMINEEGARKKVLFSAIRSIFDKDGRDITSIVLADAEASIADTLIQDTAEVEETQISPEIQAVPNPEMVPQAAMDETEHVPHKDNRILGNPFRVIFAAEAGYSGPAGDWFTGFSAGALAGGTMRVRTSQNSFLGVSFKRQWLSFSDAPDEICDYDTGGCIWLDWNIYLDEFYIIFGNMTSGAMRRSSFFYAEGGIGLIRHVMEVRESSEYESDSARDTQNKLAATLGVGAILQLTDAIAFNIEGNMRATGEGYYIFGYTYPSSPGFLFGFKGGLVLMF